MTSYIELRRDGLDVERWNMLNPTKGQKVPFVTAALRDQGDAFVFASDNMKALPDGIAKWVPGPMVALGTDGFGRSESRKALRDFFEVDERHIVFAALGNLFKQGKIKADIVKKAAEDLKIDPEKINPMIS